jgi:hypothetical protein
MGNHGVLVVEETVAEAMNTAITPSAPAKCSSMR